MYCLNSKPNRYLYFIIQINGMLFSNQYRSTFSRINRLILASEDRLPTLVAQSDLNRFVTIKIFTIFNTQIWNNHNKEDFHL